MQTAEPIRLRQVRDLGQCLSDTFTFLRQNKMIFRHALFTAMPIMIIGSIVMNYIPMSMVGTEMNFMEFAQGGGIFGSAASSLVYLIGLFISIFGYTVLMGVIHEYLRAYHLGEHTMLTTGELFQRALGQFWNYVGSGIIMPIVVTISLMLCILPVFFVGPVFCMCMAAHAIERSGGFGSWGRSYSLAIGDFWSTLGLYLVTIIIWYILLLIIQMPVILIGGGIGLFSAMESIESGGMDSMGGFMKVLSWVQIVASIVSAFAYVLTFPILCVCMCLKYFSRVEETEGRGLQEKIAGFEQA